MSAIIPFQAMNQLAAMPYSRNRHSYPILWNPAVAEQLKEVA